jgi:ribose/xylose/arabinose/galactoside ABC-type transport system permease subunit
MLPQNKVQDVFFTALMALVMVYVMICYNISLSVGGMQNFVFLAAFKELLIMWPIAVILELLFVGKLAQILAFRFVTPGKDPMILIVLAISAMSVCLMCPLMSLAATILFKDAGSEFVAVWLQTTAFNFPMALCWQIFFAGPLVRNVFGFVMKCIHKPNVDRAENMI